MPKYKEFLSYFKTLPLTKGEVDGRTKYFTSHGLIYHQEKYETKPKVICVYYSRHLYDPIMYKEFDMATFIRNQLRSTSHHVIRGFSI